MTGHLKTAILWLLAAAYLGAGILHIARPEPFLSITPSWVPRPEMVIWLTGLAEIFGALALAQPVSKTLRQAGAWGLALYAICVFPANINHFAMDMAKSDGGLGLGYHIPRMIAQPIIVALTLWVGGVLGRAERR